MKKVVLMIIPALFCGMMFLSSCNKDEVNSALSIYAFGQSTTKSATSDESEAINQGLWCTGNDIKWYNGTTGELKLKNEPEFSADLFSPNKLTIFLDDVELFSLLLVNPLSSIGSGYPFISWEQGEVVYSDCICGNKRDHIIGPNCGYTILKQDPVRYFIFNTYLSWTQEAREQMASVMGQDYVDEIDRAKATFEQGWDKFIEQLKKEGKYRK